jgi:hypothetical protein
MRTPVANRQIAGLRGRRKTAYEQFVKDLAQRGCSALDYRLTGDPPLESLCVKHLRGNDRVVVSFTDEAVWILLVGPHEEGKKAENVYTALYELAGVPAPTKPRTKPSCCIDGSEPILDELEVDRLVGRARRLT